MYLPASEAPLAAFGMKPLHSGTCARLCVGDGGRRVESSRSHGFPELPLLWFDLDVVIVGFCQGNCG